MYVIVIRSAFVPGNRYYRAVGRFFKSEANIEDVTHYATREEAESARNELIAFGLSESNVMIGIDRNKWRQSLG